MRCCKLTVRPGRDRGAVAVIVAILVGVGGLLGSVALTVDVGTVSLERRQLQNGADAAVLAAAVQCAKTNSCPAATDARLTTLANNNAGNDALTSISRIDGAAAVCGRSTPAGSVAGLPACAAVPGPALRDCPTPAGALPANYVRLYTQTKTSTGNTILPSGFAEALTGSTSGTRHQACAAAAWGPPSSGSATIPVTISVCEWNNLTSNGTSFVGPGPYNDPFQSPDPSPGIPYPAPGPLTYENRLLLHDTTGSTTCPAGPSGADLPGGFGWLATGSGCDVTVPATGWVPDDPGNSPPSGCNLAPFVGQVAFIPIYVNTNGLTGAGGSYLIDGFAAFYFTGYSIPSDRPKSIATNRRLCTSSQTCLYGWFTQAVIPRGSFTGGGGGSSRGAVAVGMTG